MGKRKDYSEYINKKFYKIEILEILYPNDEKYPLNIKHKVAYAYCKCDCGRIKTINFHDIKKGRIKTCGCSKKLHECLVGRKLGKLNIFSKVKADNYPIDRGVYYICRCDCGTEKRISHKAIEYQNQRSCGCQSREDRRKLVNKLSPAWNGIGDISGHHFASIKHNAKRRSIEFNLTKEYIWDLFVKQNKKCKLSGLDIHFTTHYTNGTFTASLDRIDSFKGYIEGNVQWVHKDVNQMKMDANQQYFLNLCQKIALQNNNTELEYNI